MICSGPVKLLLISRCTWYGFISWEYRKSLGEAFDMLGENGMLKPHLRDRLKAMVGFRNIAVHDYRKLNLDIVRNVVEIRLGDFREFTSDILRNCVN